MTFLKLRVATERWLDTNLACVLENVVTNYLYGPKNKIPGSDDILRCLIFE